MGMTTVTVTTRALGGGGDGGDGDVLGRKGPSRNEVSLHTL